MALPGRTARAAASERVRRRGDRPAEPRDRSWPRCSRANPRVPRSSPSATSTTRCSPSRSRRSRRTTGKAPRTEKDFRRLLDDKSIDAVDDRHARPLARPDDGHGLPGGQGRLRREAGQPQRRRGPADGRGGAEVQPGRPGRHPAAEHAARPGGDRAGPRRGASARSAWPAPGSTRSAPASATAQPGPVPAGVDYAMWQGPAPDRPFYAEPVPLQLALVLELGDRRAGQQRHPRRRRRPLGPGRRCARSPSPPAAASTSSTTTRKSPTPRSSPGSSRTPASSGSTGCGRSTATEGSGFGIAFYGDKGTLIIDDKGWRVEDGDGGRAASPAQGRPGPARPELPRLRQEPREAQRRHRDRPPEHPALPPRQHRLPRGQEAHLRRRPRVVPRPRPTPCSLASTASGSRCRRRSEGETDRS